MIPSVCKVAEKECTLYFFISTAEEKYMNKKRALLQANAAVLLFGMAGLFAKWISLPSIGITFGRVFFSSITLLLYSVLTKKNIKVKNKKHLTMLFAAGCMLALHWWTFLGAIQMSTVAIGTITFSTYPLFVTFMEPFVSHERLKLRNVIEASLILVGVFITVPELSFENQMARGLAAGMLSAFLYAALSIINRVFVQQYESSVVSLYEQGTAAVILIPSLFLMKIQPTKMDIGLLIILGVVATALAHTIFIGSMHVLSARMAGICASMESVYSIVLALLILGEVPGGHEIAGAVIIIGVVLYSQLRLSDA